jgi:transposase
LPGKDRRELRRRFHAEEWEVLHVDAAGIDVGNETHFVSVPPDRDPQPVREFGSWTRSLQEMAGWLKQCGIRTVALQSTGVYWIAVQEVLEEAGLEVYLVNPRGTNVR